MDIPKHLQKYIIEQDYSRYTAEDQACWRYIMRQLKGFLSVHAHESYLEGLVKIGIKTESIPKISEISANLQKIGWMAVPVSGFIPPAAFMELQSLGVLPIACDIRSLDHLLYTPAPDIVHEAAGHAPILANPDFADYLRQYAQVAEKSIISKEDLDVYAAIRDLSDIKENPASTKADIEKAQTHLDQVSKQVSHISEASELGRLNWWTAEYGLIGDLKSPKIFGAGLLSSVGESKWCLSDRVQKIPLTVECVKVGYDITEPQPQLFVTESFSHLKQVLKKFSETMSYKTGGVKGLNKALLSKTVNTVELNSGLQISGQLDKLMDEGAYLQFVGPTQLCVQNKELPNQGKTYHPQGFGTPIGYLKNSQQKCLSTFDSAALQKSGLREGTSAHLEFASGVKIEGLLKKINFENNKLVLLSFINCTVTHKDQILFNPAWGTFDMAVGSHVVSVFGGPADRSSYGEVDDFKASKVIKVTLTDQQISLNKEYEKMRRLRESKKNQAPELQNIFDHIKKEFPQEWLLYLELYEILKAHSQDEKLKAQILAELQSLKKTDSTIERLIADGLQLA